MVETIVRAAKKKAMRVQGYSDPRKRYMELGPKDILCDPVAFSRTV
jgi:hypothetical protein